MGGFTLPSGSLSGSLPTPPTQPGQPFGGFSFASGGALPGTNTNMTTPTMDPALTNTMLGYLGGNIGQGLPAFNQSVNLPSGGHTQPGQLSAPMNPVMQQLMDFMTGKSGPGALPGVLPMWQSEMAAMQGPIEQNMANLREQFGSQGALGSSEMGTAMQDYMSQTSADEMALLTSATQASLPQMASVGMDIQGIDQSAIGRAYNQFQTDLPQNSPLLPYEMNAAQMTPGASYQKQPSFLDSLLGNAGGLLGNIGSAASSAFPNMPGWMSILLGA